MILFIFLVIKQDADMVCYCCMTCILRMSQLCKLMPTFSTPVPSFPLKEGIIFLGPNDSATPPEKASQFGICLFQWKEQIFPENEF